MRYNVENMKGRLMLRKSMVMRDAFIDWLLQLKNSNDENRYTKHTVNTYIDRISCFCNKFFSNVDEEPLKQLAQNIEVPMMCCCLCKSFQEKDEKLEDKEVRLLARAFLYRFIKKQESTINNRLFKKNLFEKMVFFLCQKKSGVLYQNVIKLFFEFLKKTDWNEEHTFYDELEYKISKLEKNGVYLKYGYIEATQTTPAIIIPRAGQDYISVRSLQQIFGFDRRTIVGMIEKGKIGCCHHRKKLKKISDLNAYFLKCHSRIYKKYLREVPFTSKQEEYLKQTYDALQENMQKLMEIDASLSNKDLEKRKTKILGKINEYLDFCHGARIGQNLCWESSTEAAKRIGKTIRTAQRQAKAGKLLALRYFKGKTSYFSG